MISDQLFELQYLLQKWHVGAKLVADSVLPNTLELSEVLPVISKYRGWLAPLGQSSTDSLLGSPRPNSSSHS